jgi:hypothetical protein
MGWGIRRSKKIGLFRLNMSKSGLGVSFGVPGARIGINSKGKQYVRGGIPGTGLFYQQQLGNSRRQQAPASASSTNIPPKVAWGIIIGVVLLVVFALSVAVNNQPAQPVATTQPVAVQPATVQPMKSKPKAKKRRHKIKATEHVDSQQSTPKVTQEN